MIVRIIIFMAGMCKRNLPLLLWLYGLLPLFFVPAVTHAAGPAVHITPRPGWINAIVPSDKKIPLRQVNNGYFYQLYEEQLNIETKADYIHIIREIVSEAGIQNGSEISIGFDPSYERLDVHQITVWRNNKPISRLTPQSFKIIADEKELSRFIYQGSYSAFCILSDIRKGDHIEYAYTLTGRNPIFGNKYARDLYFQGSQPYAQLYKAVLASPSRKLNFKSFNKAPIVTISEKNGLKCYEWNITQVMPPPYADNQPGWYNNYNYIQISDYNSWQEVADWALKINPIATQLNGQLAARVAQLKAGAAGDKEKYFRSAVQMVQDEVRYMGIELGEYSHRANTPEKVYNQRYGDCKDKALLLASVLKANDIDAQMVLVNSSIGDAIDQFIPTPNAFDHAVVMATLNNKPVWVDATIAYQRGTGTNIYFPDYGKGLVLKPGSNTLTAVTPAKRGKVTITESYIIPNEKDKTRLQVTSVYTLNEADRVRDRLASSSMAETEKGYLDYYTKLYPKTEQADSVTVKDDIVKNELTTIEYYNITGLLKPDKEPGKFFGSFYANYIANQLPTIAANANTPVALNYPYSIDYTIKLIMKTGWDIDDASQRITSSAYEFASKTTTNGDTLALNYRFTSFKDFIAADKLDESRKDFKKMLDDDLSYSITYTPDTNNIPFSLNYWMLLFVTVLMAGLIFAAFKLYRTETHGIVFAPGATFTPIGGWLILIGMGLAFTPLYVMYNLLSGGYLDLNKWNTSLSGVNHTVFKAALVFEAAGDVLLIAMACFCFVLLVNRRDIFPKYITGYFAFAVVFTFIDLIFVADLSGDVSGNASLAMLKSIIYAAIWIPYFRKSVRVEQTFIVPYPHNNYSYEENELSVTDNV